MPVCRPAQEILQAYVCFLSFSIQIQGRKKRAERNVSGTLFARHSSEFFSMISNSSLSASASASHCKFVVEIERIHKHHVQAADPVFRRSVVMFAAAFDLRARFYVGDQIILTSDGIRQLGVRFSDAVQPVRIASTKAGLIEFLRQRFAFAFVSALSHALKISTKSNCGRSWAIRC